MGIFAVRARRMPMGDPEARGELLESVRLGLPPRFEAVGEALASGSDSVDPCAVIGRELAMDGASLEETLEGLRSTWQQIRGCDPAYVAVKALLGAWSDTTLAYLHQLSCEDPMTGLASLAHLRTRLAELHRTTGPDHQHALVVCEAPDTGSALTRAMRLTRLGDATRTAFPGALTVGQVGVRRVVAVVERDERIGPRVAVLRTLAGSRDSEGRDPRVWIEGLPDSDEATALLLDELARD
jgi:hypothetical protein